ncbi:hypothetical protein [Flavobacterium soli]|nr:hypothetical protein [Flavobacterium soli]
MKQNSRPFLNHVPAGATRFATALTAVARAQIPKLREHHQG